MKVVLGGIDLDNAEDADGNTWLITGMVGWDSATVRGSSLDYVARDGVARSRQTYGARGPSLSGVTKTTGGEAGFWKAYNRLLGLTGTLARPVPLTVTEDVEKTMQVYRAGEPRLTIANAHFEWEIDLTAPDPAKYGAEKSVVLRANGQVTVTNDGNYVSDGIVLTPNTDGPIRLLHDPTDLVLTTGSKEVGKGTVFNVRDRTVYDGRLNRYNRLAPTSMWWGLDPGPNLIKNLGSTPVNMTYRPVWV